METVGPDSSKLLKTITGDHELPLSVHVVVSNDDLLTEILLKLPIISLLLFKFVSKRWLSLITSPSFVMHRRQIPNIDPPSGLLRVHCSTKKYKFLPFHNIIPARTFRFETTFERHTRFTFKDSSNGLILCQISSPDRLCVYNPSINILKMLPQRSQIKWKPDDMCIMSIMKIAFDPLKSSHYKVVYASIGIAIHVQTYSSETCNWRSCVCGYQVPTTCFAGFNDVIYWNDAFHWLNFYKVVSHYKLDIANDVPVLTHIQLPLTLETTHWDAEWLGSHGPDIKLLESRGCLILLGRYCTHPHQMNIYEMSCECSEWSLKYFVNLDHIMLPRFLWSRHSRVKCIVYGEQNVDSFMVIQLDGKFVEYNFVSKTLCKLNQKFAGSSRSFAFMASFAGV